MPIREIETKEIEKSVEQLFINANYILPSDIEDGLMLAYQEETKKTAKSALKSMLDNLDAARELDIPVCQDTGMAVIFAEIGQDVHIQGGSFEEAINNAVGKAYINGYMRCSVVGDPLRRKNTENNTPAIIHTKIVDGDKIKITAAPKGFGSENMSAVKMFNPSASREDIIEYIVSCVTKAGSKPCPPVIVGVGIGGNFEMSAILAKKALTRSISKPNNDLFYSKMEKDALKLINKSGIGAQGFGGDITALAVNIEVFPTHIAGLPVAVNMGCHITRHKSAVI